MLRELARDRSRGLLGHVLLSGSPRTYFHHKVWGIINRKERAGKVRRHVGLWHESYIVPEGSYESIHFDMPPPGLAAATGVLPVGARGRRAADRFAHRRPSP